MPIVLKGKTVLLGVIGVDSGQVLICDPCYIDSSWKKTEYRDEDPDAVGEFSYNGCCNTNDPFIRTAGSHPVENIGQLGFDKTLDGAGVTSKTMVGDGVYNVYGILNEKGEVKGIYIDFEEPADVSEE